MSHTFIAVIKGNTAQAIHAAQRRGFTVLSLSRNGDDKNPTILTLRHQQDGVAMAAWLAEGPTQPPFPAGALLFYTDKDKPEDEHKKVWLAKHGWSMNDDLEGLGSNPPKRHPLVEYDLGDVVVSVLAGGRHYSYKVEIYRLENGQPKVIYSTAVGSSSKEDAARSAILGAMNSGDLRSLHWDRFRDVVREQRAGIKPKRPGWKVNDDLEGLQSIQDRKSLVEYDIGNVFVSVYDGVEPKTFFVTITRLEKGRLKPVSVGLTHADTKEKAALAAVIKAIRSSHSDTGGPVLGREVLPLLRVAINEKTDDPEEVQEPQNQKWSVSTLIPALRGKPRYMYFDDFSKALSYARERARKGKRLREGGRAYFVLSHTSNQDGVAAYRVFRAFLRAEQRPGNKHYIDKPEYVLVQEAAGPMPGDPSKTLWKVNRAYSVEILDAETERDRNNPFRRS